MYDNDSPNKKMFCLLISYCDFFAIDLYNRKDSLLTFKIDKNNNRILKNSIRGRTVSICILFIFCKYTNFF